MRIALLFFTLMSLCAQAPAADMEAAEVERLLHHLRAGDLWGEAVFADGRVRPLQVVELRADSVEVVEIVGALQRRRATYALGQFSSLRELGRQRIQPRRAAHRPARSMLGALALETLVPGAGYLYVGEGRQALALWGLSGLVAATAVATGKDGAAGWAPLSAWIKVASLFHLRDKVRAINGSRLQVGALRGRAGAAMAFGMQVVF